MRLWIVLAVALAGFLLVAAANWLGRGKVGTALELREQALTAGSEVLQARRQEKNFLLRKDESCVAKVNGHVDAVAAAVKSIAAGDPESGERCERALGLLAAYRNEFSSMVEMEKATGLTEDQGARAVFIKAARAMEAEFKDVERQEVVIVLLQLRRQEKNWQLRDSAKYLERANGWKVKLEQLVPDLGLAPDHAERVLKRLGEYSQAFNTVVELRAQEKKVNASLIDAARALEPALKELGDIYAVRAESIRNQVDAVSFAVIGLSAVLLVLCITWAARTVTKPLAALGAYSCAVASGDMEARVEGRFPPEFAAMREDITSMVGQLAARLEEVRTKEVESREQAEAARAAMEEARAQERRVQRLMDRMHDSAAQADQVSERVASAAGQLSAMMTQVRQGADVQSERMIETATAMDQMNATVLEVARNASSASDNARQAMDKAQAGADMVSRAVNAIATVERRTGDMRTGMEELGVQVESIGKVMEVISEIADQTNLLALNAAIEAARAGDAGRGFAVVADEVRKLAEKTMQATSEVDKSILAIQDSAKKNIESMRQAVKAVEESTNLATASGRSQEEIVRLVSENTQQVAGIATASEEQSAASEQINRAVDEVNRIARESAEGMAQSQEAVHSLAELAEELKNMISSMLEGVGDAPADGKRA
jgi:methyl-accepting chemotaxis protein